MSVLFSGVMVELGLYAIARVYGAVFSPARDGLTLYMRHLLLGIGAVTAVLGGIMCMLQRHLKRLLAFSTVSHGGFILSALLVPGATAGALMYVAGHGLIKGALFMCVGLLLHRFDSVDEPQLHHAGRKMTGIALIFFAAGLGLSGAPFFGTFLGKAMIDEHAARAYVPWLTGIALVSSILTGGTVLRSAMSIFLGWGKPARLLTSAPSRGDEERETDDGRPRHPLPWVMWAPPALLVILAVLVAVVPVMVSQVQQAGLRLYRPQEAATVLLGAAEPAVSPGLFHLPPKAWMLGLLATAGALAVALAGVNWFRLPRRAQDVFHLVPVLHRLHSGYIGDYVVWFMLGAGVILAVLGFPSHRT